MASFELNKVEKERAYAFIEKHNECRPLLCGICPTFAPYEYIFTPTGIGTSVHIQCPYCGEEKDITDFSNW